jgi:hypothetical protein
MEIEASALIAAPSCAEVTVFANVEAREPRRRVSRRRASS